MAHTPNPIDLVTTFDTSNLRNTAASLTGVSPALEWGDPEAVKAPEVESHDAPEVEEAPPEVEETPEAPESVEEAPEAEEEPEAPSAAEEEPEAVIVEPEAAPEVLEVAELPELPEGLEDLTKDELYELAVSRGLDVKSNQRKATLLKDLRSSADPE